jgi:hypothetical protein
MTGAYSFVCAYASTDALLARLNAMGPWTWRQGDSHWYGDYLACHPFGGVRIRIVDFPTRTPGPNGDEWQYQADVKRWLPDCRTPEPVIDAAFRDVLAAIPAHGVQEIAWFD